MKDIKVITKPLVSKVKIFKAQRFLLKLFVTGMTTQSIKALDNLRKICEENLKGRYDLEVIDLYKNPSLAKGEKIIAAPTLIIKQPLPLRRITGIMLSTDRLLVGLDLKELKKEILKVPDNGG